MDRARGGRDGLATINGGGPGGDGAAAVNLTGKGVKGLLAAILRIGLIVCLTLFSFGNIAAASYANGIPVLLYHHVSNDDSDMPELTLPTAEFDRQMLALKTAGFRTISMDELLAYMRGEDVRLPAKPVVISFDDGYEDNYTNAFPILKKYGFQATIFMVGINFDRKNRLSSKEIREMAADGFTIGAHSLTHPDLTALTGAKLAREVAGSKKKAEQVVHKETRFFAYPGGFYDLATVEAVRDAGFAGAFTVLTGLNKRGQDNVFMLRRIPVFRFTDFDRLLALLNANKPKTSLLEYDPELPRDR